MAGFENFLKLHFQSMETFISRDVKPVVMEGPLYCITSELADFTCKITNILPQQDTRKNNVMCLLQYAQKLHIEVCGLLQKTLVVY